ncbi:MAG TPA: MFS transporter [Tepidisphaeraceae bacterium]
MSQTQTPPQLDDGSLDRPWYRQITGYQWLVLAVASAGWVFDTYENQIFNITSGPLLQDLLHTAANSPAVKYYRDLLLGVFLVGGAAGGIGFGVLADRWGRGMSMILSILVYAVFSALTAAAHSITQVAVLRFLVAVGTGGEWAVAASLVAEVFPERARAHASGIFHATSVIGVGAAALAGMAVGSNWHVAYLIGIAPAALVLVVRIYIREPERWQKVHDQKEPAADSPGRARLGEVWRDPIYRRRAILGLLLAAIGLAGYWGVFVAGQNLVESMLRAHGVAADTARSKAQFVYGTVQNIGGAVGMIAMGRLCAWLGRRRAFVVMQLGALIITPLTCFAPSTYGQLLLLLPVFSFFLLGMHAGYAVYFPELFPTRQRATGAGLCFNGGRLVAAPMLWFSAWLKARPGMDLRTAVSLLGLIYIVGIMLVLMMPETKGVALQD